MTKKRLFNPRNYGVLVGRHIAQRQRATGEGYRAIGREIGIGHATLSRVARGKPPSIEVYLKLNRWMEQVRENTV